MLLSKLIEQITASSSASHLSLRGSSVVFTPANLFRHLGIDRLPLIGCTHSDHHLEGAVEDAWQDSPQTQLLPRVPLSTPGVTPSEPCHLHELPCPCLQQPRPRPGTSWFLDRTLKSSTIVGALERGQSPESNVNVCFRSPIRWDWQDSAWWQPGALLPIAVVMVVFLCI